MMAACGNARCTRPVVLVDSAMRRIDARIDSCRSWRCMPSARSSAIFSGSVVRRLTARCGQGWPASIRWEAAGANHPPNGLKWTTAPFLISRYCGLDLNDQVDQLATRAGLPVVTGARETQLPRMITSCARISGVARGQRHGLIRAVHRIVYPVTKSRLRDGELARVSRGRPAMPQPRAHARRLAGWRS